MIFFFEMVAAHPILYLHSVTSTATRAAIITPQNAFVAVSCLHLACLSNISPQNTSVTACCSHSRPSNEGHSVENFFDHLYKYI